MVAFFINTEIFLNFFFKFFFHYLYYWVEETCPPSLKLLNYRHPLCNITNFFEFLENLWASSGYRAFRLCAFIVVFAMCFYFYICKDTLGTKFRNLTKNDFLRQAWLRLASYYYEINYNYKRIH